MHLPKNWESLWCQLCDHWWHCRVLWQHHWWKMWHYDDSWFQSTGPIIYERHPIITLTTHVVNCFKEIWKEKKKKKIDTFLSSLSIEMVQVVEITPEGWNVHINFTLSSPWPQMTKKNKERGHHHLWHWHNSFRYYDLSTRRINQTFYKQVLLTHIPYVTSKVFL